MKNYVKGAAQSIAGLRLPTILVASMGRSGSTLVYDAIGEAIARRSRLGYRLGGRLLRDVAWDLATTTLRPGVVYKTHDLPREPLNGRDVRAVFIFGDASDAALSVLSCEQRFGTEWVQEHFRHLHAEGRAEDLLHRDALNFEQQIKAWSSPHSYPILTLHYSAIWDRVRELSDFVGTPVQLPARQPRSEHGVDASAAQQVLSTFRSLDEWIATLPEYRIVRPVATDPLRP